MDDELELEIQLDLIRQYANHFIHINGGLSTIKTSLFQQKIFIYEDGKYITNLSKDGYHLRGYSNDKEVYLFEKEKIINYVYPDLKPTSIITPKGEFDSEGKFINGSEEGLRYLEFQNLKKTLITLLKREDKKIDEEVSVEDFGYTKRQARYISENNQVIRDLFYSKEEQIKMDQKTKQVLIKQIAKLKEFLGIDISFVLQEQEFECEDKIIPFTRKKKNKNK